MKPQASVSVTGDTLHLVGELGFDTVPELMREIENLSLEPVRQLDCSGITYSDSAAVSLLLYLRRDSAVSLRNVQEQLRGLLDLYGVTEFFNDSDGGRLPASGASGKPGVDDGK